jgi:hypothetical protein
MTTLADITRAIPLADGRQVSVQARLPIKGKPNDDDKWWLALLLIGADDIAKAGAYWKRLHKSDTDYGRMLSGDGWRFDVPTQSYVRTRPFRGPNPSDNTIRALFLAFLASAETEMKADAKRMTTGKLPLSEWQATQAQHIKDLYIASRGVGVGGLDRLTPEDKQAIIGTDDDMGLANALTRLRRFGLQIDRGDSTAATAPSIVNRAGMYAVPAYPIYQAGVGAAHGRAVDAKGVKIEFEQLNVLSHSEHCRPGEWTMGCQQCTDAGWQNPGILPEIGERTCGPHCLCYWAWRVKEPAKLSDLRPEHFKPGTDEPMALYATNSRGITLADGRVVTLSLSAEKPHLSMCPMCKSYNVKRRPSVTGGRSLDSCKDCGAVWLHKPGSLTAQQHTVPKEMATA